MKSKAFCFVFSLFLAGCTASGPSFTDAPASSEKALLYVYRAQHAWAYKGATANFSLDGKDAFDLQTGGYTYVYLAPGHHDLTQKWPVYVDPFETRKLSLEVNAGETRYVRFMVDPMPDATVPGMAYKDLSEVPPETARPEIAQTVYQPPLP